jgi:hypothetical protein
MCRLTGGGERPVIFRPFTGSGEITIVWTQQINLETQTLVRSTFCRDALFPIAGS